MKVTTHRQWFKCWHLKYSNVLKRLLNELHRYFFFYLTIPVTVWIYYDFGIKINSMIDYRRNFIILKTFKSWYGLLNSAHTVYWRSRTFPAKRKKDRWWNISRMAMMFGDALTLNVTVFISFLIQLDQLHCGSSDLPTRKTSVMDDGTSLNITGERPPQHWPWPSMINVSALTLPYNVHGCLPAKWPMHLKNAVLK